VVRGRAWNVEINVDAIKRVRGTCGVDLLDASDKQKSLLTDLATDPVLLVDVIYVVCKPQADDRGVSDEDFGRAMAGDAIDRARRRLPSRADECLSHAQATRPRPHSHRYRRACRVSNHR